MKFTSYFFSLLLFILTLFTVNVIPAEAAFCRTVNDRTICILNIQRSAKSYWEYRALVSINGVKHPLEVYNCREHIKTQFNGAVVPFESDGAGQLICSLFQ